MSRPDAWTLSRLHHDRALNLDEIADMCGVAVSTVRRWLNDAEIAVRPARIVPPRPTVAWLVNAYVDDGRSMRSIADELEVSPSTVRRWLVEADITIRPSRTGALSRPSRRWLLRAHHIDRRTPADIGRELRVSATTVRRWLTDDRIPIRDGRRRDGLAPADLRWLRELTDAA